MCVCFRQEHTPTNVCQLHDISRHVNLPSNTNMYISTHRHMHAHTRVYVEMARIFVSCIQVSYAHTMMLTHVQTFHLVDKLSIQLIRI